jgi:ATP-dependent Lon protease
MRAKAVEYSQSLSVPSATTPADTSLSSNTASYKPTITAGDVERILGLPKFESELREASAVPGVVHGLSYQGSGMGGVLVLEAATVPLHGTRGAERSAGEPGSRAGGGSLRCTGRLGEVIQESAELAFTWVKAHAVELGVQDAMRGVDVHVGPIYLFSCQSRRNVKLMFQLHLPSGSIKKDGPSAGIAMVMAFVSLLSDRAVPPTTAMTGRSR